LALVGKHYKNRKKTSIYKNRKITQNNTKKIHKIENEHTKHENGHTKYLKT